MSLKDVMEEYFNGVKREHKLKAKNLIKHPNCMEGVRKKAIAFPIINRMITDYYRNQFRP
ncbi:hypothetical protein M4D55_10500 [Metabacillus idriensis]|uniref:hypothetical protein n=1 Tax=Metabacillus idriensis TaxID=324768 RepID=UPI00203DC82B|nr:hypothetical protein [Metabacillus idriensis]MCM3596204.1 hypothetical protein [Metabacillus idriensis]